MKKVFFLFIAVLAIVNAFAQDKPEGLFIKSKAQDFRAKDQNGNEVNLRDMRKKGPVVILFYHGYWCPYCNKELQRFQDSLHYITDKGAQLVAITPEAAEGIAKTVEKTKVTFPVIYDSAMKITNAYHTAFVVDDKSLERYKKANIDLLATDQQRETAYLPMPAVYIINRDGSVTYRYFDEDPKRRVTVKEILANLP